jgi:hypothetical protein
MLAWILIFGSWIALLSLVLHDVTSEDADGGAIRVAAGNLGAAVSWARVKARTFRETRADAVSQGAAVSQGSAASQGAAASQESVASQGATPTPPLKQRLALRKADWWHTDQRVPMAIPDLELAIADAVKKASPGCEDFVSVIVEHTTPKARLGPDWDVRGVRYGKADRRMVDEALSTVVKRMQQEIRLNPD